MNAYESMLLDNPAKLEQTIIDLINKCINEDAEAKTELTKVGMVIDFDYEISADVTFNPYDTTLYSKAVYSSITEYNEADDEDGYFHDYENSNGISWDDDCSYGSFQVDKSNSEVEVDINGLTDDASEEAKEKYLDVLKVKRDARELERRKNEVQRLKYQLERAEKELQELKG